jgi:hypothetical protein
MPAFVRTILGMMDRRRKELHLEAFRQKMEIVRLELSKLQAKCPHRNWLPTNSPKALRCVSCGLKRSFYP